MTTNIKPLTQRKSWKALAAHHKQIRKLHLRKLFADDFKRGTSLTAEGAGLYLDYSKNRITGETFKLLLGTAGEIRLAAPTIGAMFRATRSTLTGKSGGVAHGLLRAPKGATITWWTVRMLCRRSMRFLTRWRHSRSGSAPAARGPATPAGGFATSSTSASAVPISGRPWPTKR